MDNVIGVVRECKILQLQVDEVRQEINNLKSKLIEDEQCLNSLGRDKENLSSQRSSIERSAQSVKMQLEYLQMNRELAKKFHLVQRITENLTVRVDPDNEAQSVKLVEFKRELEKMIQEYEKKHEYQKILEADLQDKELDQKLIQKQNEIMKLETEREYD